MAGRAGTGGQLATEKLEILWGSRGNPRDWALRRGELVDVQKIIAEVKKSVNDLKTALQQIKQEIDTINGEILVIQNRLNDAEQAINDLDTALSALEVRIDDAEEALTAIEDAINHINGQIGNLDTDITDLQNAVAELQQGMPSLTVTADLNTAVRNKEFQWSNTSTNTPVAGSYGRGWTVASSANDLTQFGVINTTGQTFVRFRTGGTWGAWADLISLRAEPYALQSNPGATPFPAAAYTAIPFYTNGEISAGITLSSNTIFTMAAAGLYQFELEVRINGGGTSMPPVGTPIGLSIDTTTTPTALRAGYSTAGTVAALTVLRLVCTERLAAGAQRTARLLNQGAAAYQVTSAVIKITRLSA